MGTVFKFPKTVFLKMENKTKGTLLGVFIILASIAFIWMMYSESKQDKEIASLQQTETDCGSIKDITRKDDCLRNSAIEKNTPEYCKMLSSDLSASECVKTVARNTGDAGICETLNNDTQKDGCVYALAMENKNSTLCNNIRNDQQKYRCMAFTDKKMEYCTKITNPEDRDWCTLKLTLMKGSLPDIDACNSITKTETRDECYFRYLTEKRYDATECQRINNISLKDKCFYEHVKAGRMNPQLCWLIEDPQLKENCTTNFQNLTLSGGTCKRS